MVDLNRDDYSERWNNGDKALCECGHMLKNHGSTTRRCRVNSCYDKEHIGVGGDISLSMMCNKHCTYFKEIDEFTLYVLEARGDIKNDSRR
jgi:hypothetical protein